LWNIHFSVFLAFFFPEKCLFLNFEENSAHMSLSALLNVSVQYCKYGKCKSMLLGACAENLERFFGELAVPGTACIEH
jgi:hypothetical protein